MPDRYDLKLIGGGPAGYVSLLYTSDAPDQ